MPDVLIRNFPAEDLALLDQLAARLGISRTEYLRRHLQQEARRAVTTVTAANLMTLSQTLTDLADDDVMTNAWS
jgi:hypothetical protein